MKKEMFPIVITMLVLFFHSLVVANVPLLDTTMKKFTAQNFEQQDASFGWSIASSNSGQLLFVGSRTYNNDLDNAAGVVIVFRKNNGNWEKIDELFGEAAGYLFGTSIAVDGDILVVGTPGSAPDGSIYIYEFDYDGNNTITFKQPIIHTYDDEDNNNDAGFGSSVAIDGDTIAAATGLFSGSYLAIHEKDQGGDNNWGEVISFNDQTVSSLALEGNTLIVGNASDNGFVGEAHVRERDEGGLDMWGIAQSFTPSIPGFFGISTAIDGNTLLIGADHAQTMQGQGVVSVYNYDGNSWNEVIISPLVPSEVEPGNAHFGSHVSLLNGIALIGASTANVNNFIGAGASYIHRQHQGGDNQWGVLDKLTAEDYETGEAQQNNVFGFATHLTAQGLFIGSVDAETGENNNAGAVYHIDMIVNLFSDGMETL